MAIFEVYVRAEDGGAGFVGERPSIFALIVPAIWLLWHRLWFALGAYLIVAAGLGALGPTKWGAIAALLSFLPGLYVFLEGSNLIAANFERRGYVLTGLVEADSRESAELRWFVEPENRRQTKQVSTARKQVWPANKPSDTDLKNPEFGMFGMDR